MLMATLMATIAIVQAMTIATVVEVTMVTLIEFKTMMTTLMMVMVAKIVMKSVMSTLCTFTLHVSRRVLQRSRSQHDDEHAVF